MAVFECIQDEQDGRTNKRTVNQGGQPGRSNSLIT